MSLLTLLSLSSTLSRSESSDFADFVSAIDSARVSVVAAGADANVVVVIEAHLGAKVFSENGISSICSSPLSDVGCSEAKNV